MDCVSNRESEPESPTTRDRKWLKDMCLRRDNFRCIVTGFPDYVSIAKKRTVDHEGGGVLCTDVAHILSTLRIPIVADETNMVL